MLVLSLSLKKVWFTPFISHLNLMSGSFLFCGGPTFYRECRHQLKVAGRRDGCLLAILQWSKVIMFLTDKDFICGFPKLKKRYQISLILLCGRNRSWFMLALYTAESLVFQITTKQPLSRCLCPFPMPIAPAFIHSWMTLEAEPSPLLFFFRSWSLLN